MRMILPTPSTRNSQLGYLSQLLVVIADHCEEWVKPCDWLATLLPWFLVCFRIQGGPEQSGKSVKEVQKQPPWYRRQDVGMWIGGMLFMGIVVGTMWGLGLSRGWSADSGYTHNDSVTSQERFLPEPFIEEEGVRGRYGAGCVGRWYYWKVKPEHTSVWTHLFPWLCYIAHQVFIWATIYKAQMRKALEPGGPARFSTSLSSFNWWALAGNAFFHILHLVNTHVTYDATAPDVSISTSQASVIMLTVLIILLEYKERGLFFGWPTAENKGVVSQKLRFSLGPINLMRRYHGYAFAWGAIYTFWYHPMENTLGHTLGFIYTWLFMLQGSLMYTGVHLNRYWRLTQEVWVVLHAGLVAAQTGGSQLKGTTLWPMFTFGFSLCFVLTQIFTLPFWKYIPRLCRLLPLAVYLGVTLWAYSWIPDKNGRTWIRLSEIIRIPAVYYITVPLAWFFLWVFLKIEKKAKNDKTDNISSEVTTGKSVFYLSAFLLVYGVHIALAIVVEVLDIKTELTTLMIIFVLIFTIGACIGTMFLKQVIPYRLSKGDQVEQVTKDGKLQNTEEPKGVDNPGYTQPGLPS